MRDDHQNTVQRPKVSNSAVAATPNASPRRDWRAYILWLVAFGMLRKRLWSFDPGGEATPAASRWAQAERQM